MWIDSRLIGCTKAELTSADAQTVIDRILSEDVILSDIEWVDELTVRFVVRNVDFKKVMKISESLSASVFVLKQTGLLSVIKCLRRRAVMVLGLVFMLFLSIYVPRCILFIHVQGNETLTDREIIEKAEMGGLSFGNKRKEIRSEQVKNRLLEQLPQLQWVGINTSGCVATISVKERTIHTQEKNDDFGPASVVAVTDGTIRSAVATKGTLMCKQGDCVTKGQVLISAYTDCGLALVATKAQGEIFAETSREIRVVTINNAGARSQEVNADRRFSIILGKNFIKLYKDSGILDVSCVKISKKYNIALFGDFILPICIQVEDILCYNIREQVKPADEMDWLLNSADKYVITQMMAGQIVERNCVSFNDMMLYGYDLKYDCTEMIGRLKKEELFNFNG